MDRGGPCLEGRVGSGICFPRSWAWWKILVVGTELLEGAADLMDWQGEKARKSGRSQNGRGRTNVYSSEHGALHKVGVRNPAHLHSACQARVLVWPYVSLEGTVFPHSYAQRGSFFQLVPGMVREGFLWFAQRCTMDTRWPWIEGLALCDVTPHPDPKIIRKIPTDLFCLG